MLYYSTELIDKIPLNKVD